MVFFTQQEQRFLCVETNLESTVNAEFCYVNTIDPDHLVACAQYRGLVNRIRHLGPSCSNMSLCSCSSFQAQLFRPVTQCLSLQFHFLHPHLTPGHQRTCRRTSPQVLHLWLHVFMHCSDKEPQSHLRHAVVLPS